MLNRLLGAMRKEQNIISKEKMINYKLLAAPMKFEVIRGIVEDARQYIHAQGKDIMGHMVFLTKALGALEVTMNNPI